MSQTNTSLKRPSSAHSLPPSKSQSAPSNRRTQDQNDKDMGEFEDEWEDEFEEEDIISNDSEDDDDDASDGRRKRRERDADGDERMETVAEETSRMNLDPSSTDVDREEDDEDDEDVVQAHLPGQELEQDHVLKPDMSTYPLLHSMSLKWPSLSFDILRDGLGDERRRFPMDVTVVAGTQAGTGGEDEVVVMRWEGLSRTDKDREDSDDESSDDDDDNEDEDSDPILTFRTMPHAGCVNRLRSQPLPSSSSPPLPPTPYHVATFSSTGSVNIFDVAPHLQSIHDPASRSGAGLDRKPVFVVKSHGRVEGYGLAWGPPIGGTNGGGRLLSGDCDGKIYLTTMGQSSFTPSPRAFASHKDSVEDIEWSPVEPTIFTTCSADRSVRVWDVRTRERKSVLSVEGAHESDVNVLSWNKHSTYLLVTGGDEGGIKIWDFRNFQSKQKTPTPVASFAWHTAPITSVEWHPTDDSCFAASGADDQVTLWDLSVEVDEEESMGAGKGTKGLEKVPPQLLFIHMGQKEIKEIHWHPQIPGVLVSTAVDGFNVFKTISV